tara:strand:+ start:2665 stop:3462 length:798 start_codon:yes stop_codon:yes gene_type:complete
MSNVFPPTLSLLCETRPEWVFEISREGGQLQFGAQLTRAGGILTRKYNLRVFLRTDRVFVTEGQSKKTLPSFCPNRHINPDGCFCVGYNAGQKIQSEETGHLWWTQLGVFLQLQETAEETRRWPHYAFMSHGNEAAQKQLEAEAAAEELGMVPEYQQAMRHDTGPLMVFLKLVQVKVGRIVNGRAACICGRTTRKGMLLQRRNCYAMGLSCLPVLEAQRRVNEIKFWRSIMHGDQECCGTMDNCPLKGDRKLDQYVASVKRFLRL